MFSKACEYAIKATIYIAKQSQHDQRVNVKEVDPGTMESKLIKGLFFAGEMIDVDALTGGFNLQIAWSTGYLAGESADKV